MKSNHITNIIIYDLTMIEQFLELRIREKFDVKRKCKLVGGKTFLK